VLDRIALLLLAFGLAACGTSQAPAPEAAGEGDAPAGDCGAAPYPSAQWTQCEARNFERLFEGPRENGHPAFLQRLLAQQAADQQAWLARALTDPSWLDPRSGNTALTPVAATGAGPAVGDPFRHPEAPGEDGRSFYLQEAEVRPVVFYDRHCARISGRVWMPRGADGPLPGVVIESGSVQAPEAVYWWAAQLLVRGGYMVLTHDPRGQGRSDFMAPDGTPGSNAWPDTFWLGLVDAIDFFRATPASPYPWEAACAGTYPTGTDSFNPFHDQLDRKRLGLAGHSFGAAGVSFVQAYDGPGAEPWPGRLDATNPVDVVVAWDALSSPNSKIDATAGNLFPDGANQAGFAYPLFADYPAVAARVPALSFNSEYGVFAAPFTAPPDPEQHKDAFRCWQQAGVPVMSLVIAGSSHIEFSALPPGHATSWCPQPESGRCRGGWGLPLVEHYTLAWLDRWLKRPGDPGHADADMRLLDDRGLQGAGKLSFRSRSARDFPDRGGWRQHCGDIRAGCP